MCNSNVGELRITTYVFFSGCSECHGLAEMFRKYIVETGGIVRGELVAVEA